MGARGWGREELGYCSEGTVSVLQEEKTPEVMVGMAAQHFERLMSLNCILKMAKMVNIMLCVFYNN